MSATRDSWYAVPLQIGRLVKASADLYSRLRSLLPVLPSGTSIHLDPSSGDVQIGLPDGIKTASRILRTIQSLPGVGIVKIGQDVPAAGTVPVTEPWKIKHFLGPVADVTGWKEGPINQWWGGPRPLTNILAGGALGAGAGAGLGWLLENTLPESVFEKGKLRKTLTTLGALGGGSSGIYHLLDNLYMGQHPLQPWPAKVGSYHLEILKEAMSPTVAGGFLGGDVPSAGGTNLMPMIPRDRFNRIVWEDEGTPLPIRSATTGLVESASLARGDASWISPFDIARVSVSALAGMAAGKVIGALAGLTPSAQSKLQEIGTWSGLLTAVVPPAISRY